jgi:sulfur carrier protein ThiS|tara:strand:+ start:112 stop:312 length:201 start_codon:yes stop_codon:yes gene_type:complete
MKVRIEVEGTMHEVEAEEGITINQILEKIDVLPSTVLVTHGEKIVPHSTVIKSDVELGTIIVSSGG